MTGLRGRAHLEINAESVARALGGATRRGSGWWSTRCLAHDDRRSCHAGCESRAVGEAKASGLLPERIKGRAAAGSNSVELEDTVRVVRRQA